MIPASVTCKEDLKVDWRAIANHIECTLPLPALMNLDKVKLINKDG